jgi:hypothetical protein
LVDTIPIVTAWISDQPIVGREPSGTLGGLIEIVESLCAPMRTEQKQHEKVQGKEDSPERSAGGTFASTGPREKNHERRDTTIDHILPPNAAIANMSTNDVDLMFLTQHNTAERSANKFVEKDFNKKQNGGMIYLHCLDTTSVIRIPLRNPSKLFQIS